MPRRKRKFDALRTIWRVPDDLWAKIQVVLDRYPPTRSVWRKRNEQRQALNGIIHRVRSGVHWNQLPRESGDDSSAHRTLRRRVRLGIFDHIWAVLVNECEELCGVDWEWQAGDTATGKARLGEISLVPTQSTVARKE